MTTSLRQAQTPAPQHTQLPAATGCTRFPSGFAWPPRLERTGHYVVCPYSSTAPLTLAVQDDFGFLQPVDGVDVLGGTVLPLCYFPEGQH